LAASLNDATRWAASLRMTRVDGLPPRSPVVCFPAVAHPFRHRRSAVSCIVILTMAAMWASSVTAAPFTRESALEQARKVDPEAALPEDVLPEGVTAQEDLVFATMGGAELHLDLYTPAAAGPRPAVIFVHGGGWESGDRRMERPFAKRVAASGLITVPVSYRLGQAGQFPSALHDLKAAVRWLRAHATKYGIDPNQIGAVGGSAGGQLVAMLGATKDMPRFEGDGPWLDHSSAVQAVVVIDGLADFTGPELLAQQRASPSAPTRFLGRSYDEDPVLWRDASPITHVGLRSAPTLFIKSTAPAPLLPGRKEMSQRLLMVGIGSEVVSIENSPHVFWLVEPWFELTVAETTRYLRHYLLAEEA
jgi:acetyl esterase/lipase